MSARRSSLRQRGKPAAAAPTINEVEEKNEDPDAMEDAVLAYEMHVLETRRQNQEMLQQLGIAELASSVKKDDAKPARERGVISTTVKRKKADDSLLILRKSPRLSGSSAATTTRQDVAEENTPASSYLSRKLGDLTLDVLQGDTASFVPLLSNSKITPAPSTTSTDIWSKRCWRQAKSDVAKVVKERTYRVTVHPRTDRLLVLAGDKSGGLGIWDVDSDNTDGELLLLQPHRSVISAILTLPKNDAAVFTGSYDGTIRRLDLVKNKSEEIYHTDDIRTYLTSVDCKDGYTLYFSDSDGSIGIRDLRQAGTSTITHSLHDKKASSVDVNSIRSHLIVTSSLDRSVCIWDVRTSLKKPLASLPHSLSLSSAYFSPDDGRRILTTPKNDKLRVFSEREGTSGWIEEVSINHNNQTGRWLTSFRAQWLPWQPDKFIVGSMNKQIDVFSHKSNRVLCELNSPELQTVPAVTTPHPSLPIIVGAVASGRCFVFRAQV